MTSPKSQTAEFAIAETALFPYALGPVSADALAQYTWLIDRLSLSSYVTELVAIHQRSLVENPALAQLCRGQEALSDVARAGSFCAVPEPGETLASVEKRVGDAARRRYQRRIAEQIAAVEQHDLASAARTFLSALGDDGL